MMWWNPDRCTMPSCMCDCHDDGTEDESAPYPPRTNTPTMPPAIRYVCCSHCTKLHPEGHDVQCPCQRKG